MPGTELGVGSALDGDAKIAYQQSEQQNRLNELDNQRLVENSTAKAEFSDNKKRTNVVDPSITMAIASTGENALTIASTGKNAMTNEFESLCAKLNGYFPSKFKDAQGSFVLESYIILRKEEVDLFAWMSYINSSEKQARFEQCSNDCLTLFIKSVLNPT
jgi:hypothetical protein